MTRQENNRSQQISNDPERFLNIFKYYHKELDKWLTIEAYKERTDLYDKEAFLIDLENFYTLIKQYAEAVILHSYQALTETKSRTIETEQINLSLQHYKRMVKEYEIDGDTVFAYQLGKAVCDCIELFLDSLKLDFSLNVNKIGLCNDVKKLQSEIKEIINGIEPILRILPTNKTDTTQSESEITTELNIFCKTMPLNIPKEHFKRLTTNTSNNGRPFLTDIQLDNFIQKAFLGKDLSKQKINSTPKGEKLLIQSIFYEFYEINCFNYFGTHQKQEIFIKLLTENFQGWNYEKIKGNFKPKTNKRLL